MLSCWCWYRKIIKYEKKIKHMQKNPQAYARKQWAVMPQWSINHQWKLFMIKNNNNYSKNSSQGNHKSSSCQRINIFLRYSCIWIYRCERKNLIISYQMTICPLLWLKQFNFVGSHSNDDDDDNNVDKTIKKRLSVGCQMCKSIWICIEEHNIL